MPQLPANSRVDWHTASFEVAGSQLLGIIHTPPENCPDLKRAVIMCPGIGGDRVDAHRVLWTAAERFAQAGLTTLRFDCRAQGVSEGTLLDYTVDSCVEDILAAAQHLDQAFPGQLGVTFLGFSFGAAFALAAANSRVATSGILMWSPILDLKLPQAPSNRPILIRSHGANAFVWDLRWTWVTSQFFRSALRDFRLELQRYPGRIAAITGSRDQRMQTGDTLTWLTERGVEQFQVPGSDHLFGRTSYTDMAINLSLAWLTAAPEPQNG
jgi:alpha/beta superfamily hydrolase